MAIVPLHRAITKETLQEFGFSEEAAELAARANAAVDEKQRSDARETNLHAMAGYVPDVIFGLPRGRLQDRDETMRRVEERLANLRVSIAGKILSRNFREALQELGEALHTVQDRAFHNFEAWPYDGIGAAISEDPNYMFAHGVRDLGGVSRLDIRTGDGVLRYRAEWTFQLGSNSYLSVGGFCEHGATNARAARTPGSLGSDNGFRGSGGLLTFTLGAAPGSIPTPSHSDNSSQGNDRSSLQSIVTQGPAARATARAASRAFVDEIKRQVLRQATGSAYWDYFLGFRGSVDSH
jgi:hypothetical protein